MRKFTELRANMARDDLLQTDVAKILGISVQHLSHKMTGAKPFNAEEMYKLLETFGKPDEELHIMFPKNGRK